MDGRSAYFVRRPQGLFLSVNVDDVKLIGKKQNLDPMWKKLMKHVDLGEPTSFLDHVYLGGALNAHENLTKVSFDEYRKMFESQIFARATEKSLGCEKSHAITVAWYYDMEGHAKKCVERFCETTNIKG